MVCNRPISMGILNFFKAPILHRPLSEYNIKSSVERMLKLNCHTDKILSGKQYTSSTFGCVVRYKSTRSTGWPQGGMWPQGFEEPAAHKQDFPELRRSGDFQTKALSPIKSAPNSATCSLFKDPLVQKFHRLCTVHGHSEVLEKNMRETYRLMKESQLKKYYKAIASKGGKEGGAEMIAASITTDPVELIKRAIENARPLMRIEKVTVGSVEYQIPTPITLKRSEFEGMRWIINAARDRDKKKSFFYQKLAEVILETAAYTGRVIQIKNEHHKTCELNRAYAHYRRSK